MDLYHGSLYWPTTIKETPSYPPLTDNRICDVLVIGGGMSGALLTYKLAQESLDIVLVDRNKIGHGSTSANTGLLQYSNDKMMHSFARSIGENNAVRFYQLCLEGMRELKKVANSLSKPVQWKDRKSLYYASKSSDVPSLQKEYDMLRKYQFPVEYLKDEEIQKAYQFKKPAAIRTNGDAEINPLLFVTTLVRDAVLHQNVKVYENTKVTVGQRENDYWQINTNTGFKLQAKHVIYATGYQMDEFPKRKIADIKRTYAIVTNPISNFTNWKDRSLIWETKRPYFYMRTTFDGRIIAGGLDEEKVEAPKNHQVINSYGERLLKRVKEHVPFDELKVEYVYGATFGESEDGIPYIGEHPKKKNIYYCLGLGGNGTVYSSFGSTIIRDLIIKGYHPDADLVRMDR